jgi:hypothetical protein
VKLIVFGDRCGYVTLGRILGAIEACHDL